MNNICRLCPNIFCKRNEYIRKQNLESCKKELNIKRKEEREEELD